MKQESAGLHFRAFRTSVSSSLTVTIFQSSASLCLHWTPIHFPSCCPKTSTPACGCPLRPFFCAFGSRQIPFHRSRQNDSNTFGSLGGGSCSESALMGC